MTHPLAGAKPVRTDVFYDGPYLNSTHHRIVLTLTFDNGAMLGLDIDQLVGAEPERLNVSATLLEKPHG